MSDADIELNKKKLCFIAGLTQHEFNAIQFSIGETLRKIDNSQIKHASKFGFTRGTYVSLLRKMGVTSDLAPDAMTSHRDMSGLRNVLSNKCKRCGHNRMAHSISPDVKARDPSLDKVSSFLEEGGDTYCLMFSCPCKRFA